MRKKPVDERPDSALTDQPSPVASGSLYDPFYRPNETDRIERARRWLRVARGESPEPKE